MAVSSIDLTSMGIYGLAKDLDNSPLEPQYAIELQDFVFTSQGRLKGRQGFVKFNTSVTQTPMQIFEYLAADGTSRIVFSTTTDLYEVSTGSLASVKGVLSPSNGNWKFLNFNGKVLGWQASHTPIVKTGGGNFAAISAVSGTLPDGNAAVAAFGRVWAVDDDKQTIRYSALLDETRWDTADGGGLIDMRSVWTSGMDQVVAIEAYGSNLVVFGRNQIIIWTDGAGSELGIDPNNMYVTDTIDGVGLLDRDGLAKVEEVDILFWSNSGLRTLSRTIQERASPNPDVSPKNRQYLETLVLTAIGSSLSMRTTYYPFGGFVLVTLINGSTTLLVDIKGRTPQGELRVSEWNLDARSWCTTRDGTLLVGLSSNLGRYSESITNIISAVTPRPFIETGWMDIRHEGIREQALKAVRGRLELVTSESIFFQHALDFEAVDLDPQNDGQTFVVSDGNASDHIVDYNFNLIGTGSYLKIGMVIGTLSQTATELTQATLFTKPIRVA